MIRHVCIFLIAAIWTSGCSNPFSTRDDQVQPPTGGRSPIGTAVRGEELLENLKEAVQSLRPADYLQLLSDDFIFTPDEKDSSDFSHIYDDLWDKEKEESFADFFLSDSLLVRSISMLGNWPPTLFEASSDGNQEEYRDNYIATIFYLEEREDTPRRISGEFWLSLRKNEEGSWELFRWRDFKTSQEESTWGELRARFLN